MRCSQNLSQKDDLFLMRSALVDSVRGKAWGAVAPPPGSCGLGSVIKSEGLEQLPTAVREREPRRMGPGAVGDGDKGGGLLDSQILASVLDVVHCRWFIPLTSHAPLPQICSLHYTAGIILTSLRSFPYSTLPDSYRIVHWMKYAGFHWANSNPVHKHMTMTTKLCNLIPRMKLNQTHCILN